MNRKLIKTAKEIEKFEWRHHNTILLIVSIISAYFIFTSQYLQTIISKFGELGYIGGFVSGIFFTNSLTFAPATAVLFLLSKTLNPFLIALVGAAGSLISEYIIFRFVRDRLLRELKFISKELRISITTRVLKSKFLKRIVPIIAGFIIASPLPDEIAIAMLGAVKYEIKKFLLYSFLLHFMGILIITQIAKVV